MDYKKNKFVLGILQIILIISATISFSYIIGDSLEVASAQVMIPPEQNEGERNLRDLLQQGGYPTVENPEQALQAGNRLFQDASNQVSSGNGISELFINIFRLIGIQIPFVNE